MRRFLVCLLVLLLCPAAMRALSVVPRSFDELIERADTVFKGTVTSLTPQWIGEGTTRRIVTFVTFGVEETYKGEAAASQTLRFTGGTVDGVTMKVPDMPEFTVGQSAVLFVTGNGKQFCPLVGIHQGRFHITKDGAGLERVTTNDGLPVVSTSEIGQFETDGTPRLRRHLLSGERGMTAEGFKTEVLQRVAAQRAAASAQPGQTQP